MNINELDSRIDPQFLKPDDERWAAYLPTNQRANVFHHPAWSTLLAESYSYEPFVLAAFDGQGEIQAAIPLIRTKSLFNRKKLVSLPFTDHCSPLFSSQSILQVLTDHLVALSVEGEPSRIELRAEYPTLPRQYRHSEYVLHRIRLAPDASEVSNRIKPKHFRQVKVAEQRGVRIERGVDTDSVRQFFHMHTLTRRRKGVPVQPWKFFDLLVQHITQQGLGFVLLAYKDQECVAGAVFLNWNKTLVYKYSASIEKARELLAMDLILWTAIEWGCTNGYDWMDMGRSEKENKGLRYFKGRWGAEETPLSYYTISEEVQDPASDEWAKRAKPIIQRSPPWVCRAAGELLYRHFG